MLSPGESILIEQVVNGFIVSPQTITGLTDHQKDIHVFSDLDRLKSFLEHHFTRAVPAKGER